MLVDLLDEEYDVTGATEPNGADCYVVDDETFPHCRGELEAAKSAAEPGFLPVLLVRREDTRIDVQLPDHDTDERPLVDEVVTAPVDPPVLFRRLSNLLVRREQLQELRDQRDRLDEFASVVSHDLRNPLGIARSYTSLAQSTLSTVAPESADGRENSVGTEGGAPGGAAVETDDTAGAAEEASDTADAVAEATAHLDTASEAIDRMEQLIEQLLQAARAGTVVDSVEQVRLDDVAASAWRNVDTAGATLQCETGLRLEAGPEELQELLENLFRNAVEHGGETVAVVVRPLSEASGFAVADDGPGLDDGVDVFERGVTTDDEGTGLGLSIVADVAEAHGWTVRATESERGGARFVFEQVTLVDPDDPFE